MAGVRASSYQLGSASRGGEESIVFSTTDPNIVVAQAAHGKAIYHAVVGHGAYLLRVTTVDQFQIANGMDVATTLAQRAGTWLSAATAC
jgi:hypothetical protein